MFNDQINLTFARRIFSGNSIPWFDSLMLIRLAHYAPKLVKSQAIIYKFSFNRQFTSESVIQKNSTQDTCQESTPINIDTWEWVGRLMGEQQELSRPQAESLLAAIEKISNYRLRTWQEQMVTRGRLAHDLHLLAQRTQLLSRRNRERTLRSESEWWGKMQRLSGELQVTLDTMRDLIAAVRTETALAVGELKAEGQEVTRKSELCLNRLRGELATAVATFKSGCEHAKARATSLFTGTSFI